MNKSYVIGYTIFPKGYGTFRTRFEVFNDKKCAVNFYKRLYTENKMIYEQVDIEQLLGDDK